MSAQERIFDVAGIRIHGRYWPGESAEPLLAVHGWLDNAASFDALGAAGISLLALDMPGNGRSDDKPAHATYNIWDDLLILLAVADQMGWAEFSLVGHSRGAMMSTLLAASCPERVKRLICLDGMVPGVAAIEDTAKQLGSFLRDYRAAPTRKPKVYPSLEELISKRQRSTSMSESAVRTLAERGAREVEGGWVWHADARLKAASAFKMSEAHNRVILGALVQPVLLILAERGYANYPGLRVLLAEVKHATVVTLPGGHHFHMDEAVDEIAARIKTFILPPTGETRDD